ncbi:MAG: restriction endonuclease subunit S [Xenococcaceae cyanobacterium]
MQGWKLKTLGEIAEVQSGGTPLKSHNEYWFGDIPWYSSGELNDTFTKASKELITPKGLEKSNAKLFPKGSLLIGMYDTAALKMSILDRDAAFNQAIAGVKPNENIDLKFILFAINSRRFEILNQRRGVRQKNLSLAKIKNIALPIPSLPEQKRIVAILDEAFEGIDRAIANTEKNLANSRELFESYLNAIFTQKGDGWKEKKLGEIGGKVFTGPFGSLLHKSDYISNEIPIVNPANIEDDKIIPNFNKTVSQDIVKRLQAYILKQNDVVVGRRGEIGRCAVVREEQAGWLCGSGSFFIKPFENVDSVFLANLLRSAVYRNKLESLATGATMQNLSNQSLSDLVIAMPSLDEQNRITNKIDDLRIETQQLEIIYRQKLAALKELKQSILQKAFTGELTVRLSSPTTADTPKTAKKEIAA